MHQAEMQFDRLANGVRDYAIFLLDANGIVQTWNAGAERIKGYSADEIIGRSFETFYTSDAIEAAWPRSELERAGIDGRFEDEGWRVRKDGSRFWANVVITSLRDPEGKLTGFLKITRDLTDRKSMEERLLEAKNQLEIRVAERTRELEEANQKLVAEVAERRRAEAALEIADRRKDEFLAMLGHELRNPLAPIRNALHLMKMRHSAGDLIPAQIETSAALGMMERQVEQLVKLVEDLLDVARIVRGQITLDRQEVCVSDVISRGIELIRPVIDAHGHELSVTLDTGELRVNADTIRLSQVVANLLENAAKYQDKPGRIWLIVEADGTQAVIRVRDTGTGIPIDLLPHVFEVFVQDERGPARTKGGLGIGLALVKRLVELHGGTVSASSLEAGAGSEFVVRLPAIERPIAEKFPGAGACSPPPSELSRRRILVVDDNVDAAVSLARLLSLWGHETKTAHDGPTALEVARSTNPEVVLLDIGLPGMDGYEVARQLRSDPTTFGPVVLAAVTGYGQDEDLRRSHDAGFDRHFTKPVDLKVVNEFLATTWPSH